MATCSATVAATSAVAAISAVAAAAARQTASPARLRLTASLAVPAVVAVGVVVVGAELSTVTLRLHQDGLTEGPWLTLVMEEGRFLVDVAAAATCLLLSLPLSLTWSRRTKKRLGAERLQQNS